MRKPNDNRLSEAELSNFRQQAADLRVRLAASGLNFSEDACITIIMLIEAERLLGENRRLLDEVFERTKSFEIKNTEKGTSSNEQPK